MSKLIWFRLFNCVFMMSVVTRVYVVWFSMCFEGGKKDWFGVWRWQRGAYGSRFSGSSWWWAPCSRVCNSHSLPFCVAHVYPYMIGQLNHFLWAILFFFFHVSYFQGYICVSILFKVKVVCKESYLECDFGISELGKTKHVLTDSFLFPMFFEKW